MKTKKTFSFLLAVTFVILNASIIFAEPAPAPVVKAKAFVRVLVTEEKRTLSVTVKGDYKIWALPSGQLLKKGNDLQAVVITPTPAGLKLGKEEWAIRGIRI